MESSACEGNCGLTNLQSLGTPQVYKNLINHSKCLFLFVCFVCADAGNEQSRGSPPGGLINNLHS